MTTHRRIAPVVAFALTLAFALGLAVPAAPALAQGAADIFTGFQAKSNDPVEVDAQSLEIYEEGNQRISVFSGGVEVRRGNTLIRAATIKLFSALDMSSPDAFTRIEAGGDVFVRSGEQTVTGKSAVVDMTTSTIVIGGGVVLAQGTNVITGSRLVVNLATGRARVEQETGKRIRGVFAPGG